MIQVAVGPSGPSESLARAVARGGGVVSDPGEAEVLLWTNPGAAEALAATLDQHPAIHWVQLLWAGIELQVDVVRAYPARVWTSAKGVCAEPVAELALTLLLACFRDLGTYARATKWTGPVGRNLWSPSSS